MQNPLLLDHALPAFNTIRAEHAEPALRELLDDNRRQLAALLDAGAGSWDSLVVPLERMHHRLARAWSPIGHLNGVMNDEAMRAAYNACLPLLTAWHTELAQNERLCRAYERVLAVDGEGLTPPQRKLIDNALRDFRLAGVSLPEDRKRRFGQIMEELATAQARFDENVLDSTNAWSKQLHDGAVLHGLPAATVQRAREAAAALGEPGWRLSLDAPTYLAVMSHAENAALRREFHEAWLTRASELGPQAGRWDNGALIERILALRHEAAGLVGFENYAQYSLATKMAKDPAEVLQFLRRLAEYSRPAACREFAALEAHAGATLNAWDVAYWSERMKRETLEVSEEAMRPYFPLQRVLEGLFTLTARLFGVRIAARDGVQTWHPDVRYFDVLGDDGEQLAGFFIDAYARPGKRGGAWMDECVGRMRLGADSATPVAYLVCNFTPPLGERQALLTHHDVLTLFHEFGHGLHHVLTRVDYPSVSGINGVPWDAVELPSQFMENFAWREEVLPLISAHVDDGSPLPRGMLARLQRSRSYLSGMQTVRQLEFALFDLRLHAEYAPARGAEPLQLLAQVRADVAVVPAVEYNRLPHSFQHIFSGGYAAGYYSYKWAEVLSADAFGAFEEHGIFDANTADRFRHSILERGGSRDAMEAFVEFRGRQPAIEPLLRQMGLAA